MTDHEAMQLLIDSYENYSKPDEYQIIEALKVLVDETKDPAHMVHLGSLYREAGRTDLALKYYTMAETLGNPFAYVCLGQMWYDGNGVPRDIKKAFEYYSKAAGIEISGAGSANVKANTAAAVTAANDMNAVCTAAYLIADMYKAGEYVEKDYGKYCEIIEGLYESVKGKSWKEDDIPISEVLVRTAEIRAASGKTDEAIDIMLDARDLIAEELEYVPTAEVLSLMERLISDLYGLVDFDPSDFSLFDLYQLLKEPRKVGFRYDGQVYEIEAVRAGCGPESVHSGGDLAGSPKSDPGDLEEPATSDLGDSGSVPAIKVGTEGTTGRIEIQFDGKWYRSVKEFFEKAFIGENLLVTLDAELYGWEVLK